MEIKFKILGKPRGKQRPRMCVSFGKQVTYTPKQTSEYEKLVKASYMAVSKMFFKKGVPLEVSIFAFLVVNIRIAVGRRKSPIPITL